MFAEELFLMEQGSSSHSFGPATEKDLIGLIGNYLISVQLTLLRTRARSLVCPNIKTEQLMKDFSL